MEAESITLNVCCTDISKRFELKWAIISLGSPDKNMVRYSANF